jgi:sporulation protein YlmC with PRC-barrel domain
MIRIFLPLICAALGLAAASCSQSEGPFAPAETTASSSPVSDGTASAAMASPSDPAHATGTAADGPSADGNASAPPATPSTPESAASASPEASTSTPAARRVSTLLGMAVVSADGSPLGKVKDIIFDPSGRATHLIVAYASGPGPEEIPEGKQKLEADGRLIAVPWDTAVARITDGKLVLDGSKLQSAPSFAANEWPNLQDPAWSASADAYWRKVAPTPMSARRNAQIDSTARLRARPTRDGE